MAARFQGDVKHSAFGVGGAGIQGVALGMKAAVTLMVAFSNDFSIFDHDTAHQRVGMNEAAAFFR